MSNPTNKYCTPVGLQQPSASDLTDGTTGSGTVVLSISPALTGTPTAPTASPGTNTTQLATCAFALANGGSTGVPRPNTRRWAYIAADGNTSGLPVTLGIGDTVVAFTSAGSLSGAAPTSTAPASFSVSTGSSVSATAHFNGAANYRTGRNILFQICMRMADTYTTVRSWAGVMNTNPSGTTTPVFPIAAFRALAGTDTNFQCVTSNSVSTTVTDSGVTADNGWHKFQISFNDSIPNVQFYIDGTLVATNTTNLPVTATDLFFATTIDLPSGSASRIQSVGWVYLETDL